MKSASTRCSSSTSTATTIALTPGNTWIELAEEVPTIDPAKTGVDMIIKPAA